MDVKALFGRGEPRASSGHGRAKIGESFDPRRNSLNFIRPRPRGECCPLALAHARRPTWRHHEKRSLMAVNKLMEAPRPANIVAPTPPARRRALPGVMVITAYLVLGIVAYWPVVPEISHHIFSGKGDLTLTVWYLGMGAPRAHPRPQSLLQQRHVRSDRREPGTEHGSPSPGIDRCADYLGIWPSGLDEPVDGAGHADLGDRRVRGPAQVAGVGSGSCVGWADLWILALHGGPEFRPSSSVLCTTAAFHRDDSRFDLAASGSTPPARDPARPPGCGPIPCFAGSTGHSGRPHRRGIGVCRR